MRATAPVRERRCHARLLVCRTRKPPPAPLTGHTQRMPDYPQHMGLNSRCTWKSRERPEQIFDKIANSEQIDRYFAGHHRRAPRGGRISFGWRTVARDRSRPSSRPRSSRTAGSTVRARDGGDLDAVTPSGSAGGCVERTSGAASSGSTVLHLRHAGWHPSFESEAYRSAGTASSWS